MGNVCSICCLPDEKYKAPVSNERTPLLIGTDKRPGLAVPTETERPSSARNRPSVDRDTEVEAENYYKPIAIQRVGLDDIDKQFMDHANLYNEFLVKWNKLNELVLALREAASKPDGTLTDTMKLVKIKLAGAEIIVKRKYQYCIELSYDKKEVPEELDDVLINYNKANSLTRDLIDKGPVLSQSIDLVLKNEERGKRDILVYSAEEQYKSQGPAMLKCYMANYMELKKVPSILTAIKKKTMRYFEDLKMSAQQLLIDEDVQV